MRASDRIPNRDHVSATHERLHSKEPRLTRRIAGENRSRTRSRRFLAPTIDPKPREYAERELDIENREERPRHGGRGGHRGGKNDAFDGFEGQRDDPEKGL